MSQIKITYAMSDADADDKKLHNRLIDLLDAVDRYGSLAAAVEAEFDSSYRHVWNELKSWEEKIGQPLLERGRGKPGQLTPFAKKLLTSVRAIHARYKPHLDSLRTDLLQAFAKALDDARPVLTFTGCPDNAVMHLRKAALKSTFFLDVNFNSSTRGLEDLHENRTQLTGFNFPIGAGSESSAAQAFRHFLEPGKMKLIRFCTRIQGIAVAKGNPMGIHSLLDVSLKNARYAQRAKGSGTRVLFDDLLRTSGMTDGDITTCARTANSHADVAAMISQSQADAGICLANIAADAGLDFIPISREIYFMACQKELLQTKAGQDFLTLLGSTDWKEDAEKLLGYDFSDCGKVMEVQAAIPWF